MAHWYVTCHGNAVNLDFARQIFVQQGHDGTHRVVAEFPISETESANYSLETGFDSEEDADASMRRILFAPSSLRQDVDMPEIRQAATSPRRRTATRR